MARNSPKEPQEALSPEHPPILERPDGFYWRDEDTGAEFGPFLTVAEAIADAETDAESDYEPGETLQEAESELGIAEPLDPDATP